MNEHKIHIRTGNPLDPNHRFQRRKIQPAVYRTAPPDKERGERRGRRRP